MGLFGVKAKKADLFERRLRDVLRNSEAPTFPAAVMRILRVVRCPESSSEEVAEALHWDPQLLVRVLSTVNSAAYAPTSPITSVEHAASFMGRAALEQLVLAVAVRDALPNRPAPGFDPARYWRAASFRAGLARRLAERIHPARQAECFTVGLLQDLAIPVLATARPDEYGPLLDYWHRGGEQPLETLERKAFGWAHPEVGALLGNFWDLPGPLVDSIQRHHNEHCDDRLIAPAIRLVSILRETWAEHGVDAFVERAKSDYGIESDWTAVAVREVEDQADELARMLG